MKNLIENINALSIGTKRHRPDWGNENTQAQEARYIPAPVAEQDRQFPITKRSCEASIVPSTPKDRTAALRFRLRLALQQLPCEENDDQQQERKRQLSGKTLDRLENFDVRKITIDSLGKKHMKNLVQELEVTCKELGTTSKLLCIYLGEIATHLMYSITDDYGLLTLLMAVLSRHPSMQKHVDWLTDSEEISTESDQLVDQSDLAELKIALLFNIASADMLLMQRDELFFKTISDKFLQKDGYFTSLEERAVLFEKAFFSGAPIGFPILSLLNKTWWQCMAMHNKSDEAISASQLEKKINRYRETEVSARIA